MRAPVCKLEVLWFELPEVLRSGLHGAMESLRRDGEQEGQPRYSYVYRQSGNTGRLYFIGWQVQLTFSGETKLTRIAKVNDSRVGALAAVAALLDSSLRDKVSMYKWMHEMVEGGDDLAKRWLDRVSTKHVPLRYVKRPE